MENRISIQPYAFEPVYSEDEGVSDSEDSDLEGNSDSERVEIQTVVDAKSLCLSI